MSDVTIRPFQPPDREAVLALAPRLTIGVAPWRDPVAVQQAVAGWVQGSVDAAAAGSRHGGAVLVAEDDGDILGAVSISTQRHFTGELDAYVGELVVAEHAQRRGIGRRLMVAAEQWAREQGLANLTLETGAANQAARGFYRALGYQEEGVRLTKLLG